MKINIKCMCKCFKHFSLPCNLKGPPPQKLHLGWQAMMRCSVGSQGKKYSQVYLARVEVQWGDNLPQLALAVIAEVHSGKVTW